MRDGGYDLCPNVRVHSHLHEFIFVQRTGLVQDTLGNEDLTHIVNAGGVDQVGSLLGREAERPGDYFGITRHQIAVAGSLQFARLGGPAQRFDRFLQDGNIANAFSTAQLVQG